MVPLYAARVEDLGPGDFVKVDCAACGHTALTPEQPLMGYRRATWHPISWLNGGYRAKARPKLLRLFISTDRL